MAREVNDNDKKVSFLGDSAYGAIPPLDSGTIPGLYDCRISGRGTGSGEGMSGIYPYDSGDNVSRSTGEQNSNEISALDFAYWAVSLYR